MFWFSHSRYDNHAPGDQRSKGYWVDRVWSDMKQEEVLAQRMALAKQARAAGRVKVRPFVDVLGEPLLEKTA